MRKCTPEPQAAQTRCAVVTASDVCVDGGAVRGYFVFSLGPGSSLRGYCAKTYENFECAAHAAQARLADGRSAAVRCLKI